MALSSEPPFSRIGIAGLGLIGGSVALASRVAWPAVVTIGFDHSSAVAETARRSVVDDIAGHVSGLRESDLIVIATPIDTVMDLLPILSALDTRAVVTDVGSTKRPIMAAAAQAGLTQFVGGHPMAGSERGGLGQARSDLFEGRPWLLVNPSPHREIDQRLEAFVRGLGAVPLWIDADSHDRTVAYISHLPQVIAIALMNAAFEAVGERGMSASGRAFAEMTRLASSPPDMWQTILEQNADFIAEALARFSGHLPKRGDLENEIWVRDQFGRADRARARTGEVTIAKR